MKTFAYFVLFLVLATVVIILAALLGDLGAWYFAWLIGTVMIVLVAAAGAALLDAQEERALADAHRRAAATQFPRVRS